MFGAIAQANITAYVPRPREIFFLCKKCTHYRCPNADCRKLQDVQPSGCANVQCRWCATRYCAACFTAPPFGFPDKNAVYAHLRTHKFPSRNYYYPTKAEYEEARAAARKKQVREWLEKAEKTSDADGIPVGKKMKDLLEKKSRAQIILAWGPGQEVARFWDRVNSAAGFDVRDVWVNCVGEVAGEPLSPQQDSPRVPTSGILGWLYARTGLNWGGLPRPAGAGGDNEDKGDLDHEGGADKNVDGDNVQDVHEAVGQDGAGLPKNVVVRRGARLRGGLGLEAVVPAAVGPGFRPNFAPPLREDAGQRAPPRVLAKRRVLQHRVVDGGDDGLLAGGHNLIDDQPYDADVVLAPLRENAGQRALPRRRLDVVGAQPRDEAAIDPVAIDDAERARRYWERVRAARDRDRLEHARGDHPVLDPQQLIHLLQRHNRRHPVVLGGIMVPNAARPVAAVHHPPERDDGLLAGGHELIEDHPYNADVVLAPREIKNLQTENQRLRTAQRTHDTKMRLSEQNHEFTVRELRSVGALNQLTFSKQLQETQRTHEATVRDLQTNMQESQRTHEATVRDLRTSYEATVRDLRTSHETTVRDLREKIDELQKDKWKASAKLQQETSLQALRGNKTTTEIGGWRWGDATTGGFFGSVFSPSPRSRFPCG